MRISPDLTTPRGYSRKHNKDCTWGKTWDDGEHLACQLQSSAASTDTVSVRVSSGPQSQCGMEAGLFKSSNISLEQPSHQYRTAKPQGLLGEPTTTLRTIHTHNTVCLCFFSWAEVKRVWNSGLKDPKIFFHKQSDSWTRHTLTHCYCWLLLLLASLFKVCRSGQSILSASIWYPLHPLLPQQPSTCPFSLHPQAYSLAQEVEHVIY